MFSCFLLRRLKTNPILQASPVVETKSGAREASDTLVRAVRGTAGNNTSADALLLANMLVSSVGSDAAATGGVAVAAASASAPPLGVNEDGEAIIGPALPPTGQVCQIILMGAPQPLFRLAHTPALRNFCRH